VSQSFDAVIIGAGAAGLFCAGVAGQLGLKVLVIDHSPKVAEKIRISGGGRCNFTNLGTSPTQFLSQNPHFCRSALSRYTPQHFIDLLKHHGVAFHEKHKGQMFCDHSANDIVKVLLAECAAASAMGGEVSRWQPCQVHEITYTDAPEPGAHYHLVTDQGPVNTPNLVVATGGLSIPKIGASDFGHRIARQFGLRVVETRPGLVPLTFDNQGWQAYAELAGLALPVHIQTGAKKSRGEFLEDLLFTHRGLSGPAVLQISNYWQSGTPIQIDLHPQGELLPALAQAKLHSRKSFVNELSQHIPTRLAHTWCQQDPATAPSLARPINEVPDKALGKITERLQHWELTPTGTEGYAKAEVTLGGVDTRDLSQQTLMSKQPGLFFIGEVVDVTGWLGGYNFQWAWASGFACAQGLAARANLGPSQST
jgi:predicted Rossmann fold flavoprotein